MKKRTVMQATDPVVSRKVANPDLRDRGGSTVFTSGVKTLTAITAVTAVAGVFVPAVFGIAVFTGLLAVLGFGAAFLQTVKFDNQYDARSQLVNTPSPNATDNMFLDTRLSPTMGTINPSSPYYEPPYT